MTNPTNKQPKDGQAGWIMGYGMPKPDTVESVLAEMRAVGPHEERFGDAIHDWAACLAAAHKREVSDLETIIATQEVIAGRICTLVETAEALLREARNWIDNDTDEVAAVIARIDARLGATNG